MKKLRRDKVIEELQLLASGANGGNVFLDPDSEWPNLTQLLYPDILARFANAVQDRWFTDEAGTLMETWLFELGSAEKWTDFATLADEIIEERKRLALAGQGNRP